MHRKLMRRLAIVIAIALGLAGCDRLDCFDDGPLEESYGDGASTAEADNQREYARGRADGLGLNREAGEADGFNEG